MMKVAPALILILSFSVPVAAQGTNYECDFSSYKPLVIDHALLNAAIKKVQPQYPEIAKAAHVEGEVKVKILVDRKGNVIKACTTQGHSLLRLAAEEAALEWKFKSNFGFSRKSNLKKWQYIQSWIVFTFHMN